MNSKPMLSRRMMLRGLGVSVALPLLDAMLPAGGLARAAETVAAGAHGASAPMAAPVRMAMFFTPNGMWMPDFIPTTEGSDYELPASLAPLKDFRAEFNILSGLAQENARGHGDGGGDHARSAAAFLTGIHPYKTSGKDIKLGVSMDQVVAQQIGGKTRLPSLELGLDKGQTAGQCDSGYSCAYTTNISWRGEAQPMPKEVDPAALFDRLFGSANDRASRETTAKRMLYRKSILDFVADDASRLNRRLGSSDQHKLDEFTTSIREIEKRVETARAQALANPQGPKPEDYGARRPDGIPTKFSEHFRLMCDMMVLAFRMDVTRISTLMVAREGSNRTFPEIGISDGHHTVSHHGHDADKIAAVKKIDHFHMEQYAYFLGQLKAVKEGEGTLLDNCMVLMGAGIADGNQHSHYDLPIILAGKAGGALKTGQHLTYPKQTPLCNLYLAMFDTLGVKADRFGDSNNRLQGLSA
jgi:hypothetical protein